ncbi:hypothetical protein H5410_019073 [Solanum commersonii]|uniref:CCHC-type domain-containing protein n=1 Tax=Solanum commersonii TaxID=4109 RepID=A0A9J6A3Y3_SOLCO|nr:hypothetical protein H5410_019073 [Solanum commersonii]
MSTPLLSINHAYSLLIQDEKQREIRVSQHSAESAFMTTKSQFGTQRFNRYPEAKKNTLQCSHCKKPGHSADKCYRIIGFPADFKFTKSKKTQFGTAHGHAAVASEAEGSQSTSQKHITQE